jgi:hypothetical protein
LNVSNADPNVQNLESELSGELAKEPELPEKFRGKNVSEIVQMFAAVESELGRKNNEVGKLRELTDRVLGLAQAQSQANQPPKKPITSEDLLADPERVVTERAREVANERSLASEERMTRLEGELSLTKFERKFPTYQTDLTSPQFLNWVQGSTLRQMLATRAAQGDYTSAEELFTLYGESRPAKSDQSESANLEAANKAGLAKGGGAAVSDTSSGGSHGKKIYKREDLINMRIHNREEFDRRFADEFLPAYKENRVR